MADLFRAYRLLCIGGNKGVLKTIYIILSRSETFVSKIIGAVTAEPFTHASIAFDDTLSPMYSFARKRTFPLPGGLRLEYVDKGYYKEHKHIPCALYSLEVSDEVYCAARNLVAEMLLELDRYNYNVIGLVLCKLNIAFSRPYHFFCSEFVSNVLERSHALKLPKTPSLMRPSDYTRIPGLELRFNGEMQGLARYLTLERAV